MTLLGHFQVWLQDYLPSWASYLIPALVGIASLLIFILIMVLIFIFLERRGVGKFQVRLGPNRVGPQGILQPIADAIKILTKEDIVPAKGDKWVHWLAPVVALFPALMIFAVVPFGMSGNDSVIFTDLNIGILYVVAISSLAVVGVFMAGWGSNNKYSLLSAMRAIAQMVSYEIPLVLSILGVVLVAGSLSLAKIVEAQNIPFLLLQPLGFLIYFICSTAEINRSPFDLLEAESEIVAGYHTEYSGTKFVLFYMAEYGHALAMSTIAATLFLSGWRGPLLPPFLWFVIKVFVVFFLLLWIRSTLPRLRVDQLMAFAWKGLFPLALINMLITGAIVAFWPSFPLPVLLINIVLAGVLILAWSKFFKLGGGRVEV